MVSFCVSRTSTAQSLISCSIELTVWLFFILRDRTGVSFDVILRENSSDFEVRYYRVDANPTMYGVVGARADLPGSTAYTAFMNRQLLDPTLTNELQGATMTYHYTGMDRIQACGAFGFSLRQAATAGDISWTNSTTGRTYYHRVCGLVEATACSSSPVTSVSTLCETQDGRGIFSATTFNPAAATWSRTTNGIGIQQQTGTYCPSPLAAPRIATIEYICSRAAVVPVLVSVTTPNACTYNAIVNTVSVCDIYVPSSSSAAPSVPSSSAFAQVSSSSIQQVPSSTAPSLPSSSSSYQSTSTQTVPLSSSSQMFPSVSSSANSQRSSSSGMAEVESSSKSSGLAGGAIAGIVIGVLLAVLITAFLLFFLCSNQRKSKGSTRLEDNKSDDIEHSDVRQSECIEDEVEMTSV